MIKVAILSFWHVHAKDYARDAIEHPDTQIVALWDELPERGRMEAENRGIRFYEDLDDLLAQSDIDAVKYPSGALAIVEAGFVNRFSPFVIEVHGTEGSLLYSTHDNKIFIRSAKLGEEGMKEWLVEEQLPENRPSAFSQWVGHIQNDTFASENIQIAVNLTRLMEASNISSGQSGIAVRLDSL